MTFALKARVVVPVDRPPIEGGIVTIEGEQIVDVSTNANVADVRDLGDVALLPGFVNAHTHLEFSYLRQPLGSPGIRLVDWIRLVIAERGRRDVAPLVSSLTGWNESSQNGTTTVCDIVTTVDSPFAPSGDVVTAVEVIGFSRARAASALSFVIEQLNLLERADWGLAETLYSGVPFAISPHAPYTVSPTLMRELVDLARARKLPVVMHVAESAEELELLATGGGPFQELLDERSMWDVAAIPRGSRPLDCLRMLAEAPRALVIHGNYLDAEERSFLAAERERMTLVYCPRTHAFFEHPPYPLPELLDGGVRVALGTDSRASNPDLDLLAEMRHVAAAFPSIDPRRVLRMGTLDGAEALGRAQGIGSITAGKLANLVAVPLADGSDAVEAILGSDAKVNGVWLRGQQVAGA